MEIVRERLEQEFDLSLIAPPLGRLQRAHREVAGDRQPSAIPPAASIDRIEEPFLTCTILTPTTYTGTLMGRDPARAR